MAALGLVLLSGVAPAAAGPLEDKAEAYLRGDYATALAIWRPLAEGSDAKAPAKPRHDETLIRALGRAHRWKRMLEGTYRSINALAEVEKINRAYVCRLLNLTLLAPDIQEAILDGRQPTGMQIAELTRAMPSAWGEQRELACLCRIARHPR